MDWRSAWGVSGLVCMGLRVARGRGAVWHMHRCNICFMLGAAGRRGAVIRLLRLKPSTRFGHPIESLSGHSENFNFVLSRGR